MRECTLSKTFATITKRYLERSIPFLLVIYLLTEDDYPEKAGHKYCEIIECDGFKKFPFASSAVGFFAFCATFNLKNKIITGLAANNWQSSRHKHIFTYL